MSKYLLSFLIVLIINSAFVFAQTNPKIVSIVNKVNIDSLFEDLKALSGEKQIKLSTGVTSISSRAYNNYGNLFAEEYLQIRLKQYGLKTTLQTFDGGGGNIIAVQQGTTKADQQIIICAHFDDKPSQGPAPGADDNGSGTAAVLEAARILSQYQTEYTIVYALWDNEEIGLLGSYYYAQQASLKKDSIVAVINMDMIGWDSNNDNLAEIHTKGISNSNLIASNMIKINSDYGIGLQFAVINPGSTSSDHSSFWKFNYSAVLLIEGYYSGDFNLWYHKSYDNISYINKTYYEKCTKVSIGTLAYYAGIQSATSIKQSLPTNFSLSQNYPNPFNPSTKIKYSIENQSHVRLIVYDALGRQTATLVDEYQAPNDYEVKFEAGHTLSSGIYFYVLYAGDKVSVRKMILTK